MGGDTLEWCSLVIYSWLIIHTLWGGREFPLTPEEEEALDLELEKQKEKDNEC